tara:strand:+ start:10690 stop:11262 length:573 start_codon:yes stop_codon:yes gene_type:complete
MVKRETVKKQMFNKSYTYILPILSAYMEVIKAQLVNAFIGSEEYNEYDNHIFLLYKYIGNPKFIEYEDYLEHTKLFKAKYDPDKYHVMFIFNVPKEHQEVYDLFKKGKYSKFPQLYKIKILDFHNIINEEHKVAKVLYRHPDLKEELEERLEVNLPKESEVSSVPDLNIEIYLNSMKIKDPLIPPENPFD